MNRHSLSRRAVLRGVIGGSAVSMGLPLLEAMCNRSGTALAAGEALPKWFGVFFWGNGVRLSSWVPTGTGSGAAWQLSPALAAFAPVKQYLSVITGTKLDLIGGEIEHSQGICNLLAGGERIGAEGPTATQPGITVDQIVAKSFGQTTQLKSLELGVAKYNGKDQGTPNKYLSHNGPNNFNPPELSPDKAFARLFGGTTPAPAREATPTAAAPDRKAALRQSVLDAVKADATRLSARLGSPDRARLDQHLEGIRALERRIAVLAEGGGAPASGGAGGACRPGQAPGPTTDIEGTSRAMNRVIALALSCGVTRVFSDHFCGPRDDTVFTQAGVSGPFHTLTHNEGGEQPNVQKIVSFIMKQLADLLTVLRDTPAGAGNLLDLGCLMTATDCAEGRPHSGSDYPLLLAGKAGGSLKGDVHFRSNEKATNVVATALKAVGVDAPFGISARCKPTRVITEVLV